MNSALRSVGVFVLSVVALASNDRPCFGEDAKKEEVRKGNQICLAEPDGSAVKMLAEFEGFQQQGSPTFSQDGKLLAFDSWRPQLGETFANAQIIVANSDGSNARVLIDGAMPSFSPRGKRIAFSRYSTGNSIWIIDAQDPTAELIKLNDGWGADWSPDGSRIAYSTTAGGGNIGIVDIVDGDHWDLFEDGKSPYQFIYWNTAWSPDSKRIVFKGVRPEGGEEIAIIDARGAQHGFQVRLKEKTSNALCWRPDGRILVAQQDPMTKRRQLFSFDPNDDKPLERLPGLDPAYGYDDPAISSDGKRLAFTRIAK